MPLNTRVLRIEVLKKVEPIFAREVRALAKADFVDKKAKLLEEFDNHKVTQELEGGPTAFSSIPELVESGGNLFAFLGFLKGKRPTTDLREYLDNNITLVPPKRTSVTSTKVIYKGAVKFPTIEEVNKAMAAKAPLPWTERSFTQMIQKGIPGLPSFIFRENPPFQSPKPSQSSTGLQAKNADGGNKTIRSGSFKGVSYINELLDFFKRQYASSRSRG